MTGTIPRPVGGAGLDSFPLRELATSLLPAGGRTRWRVREDGQWCHLSPRDYPARVQGWKLHVSATWLSAPLVLHHAGRVLVAHGCAFKFAGTLGQLREFTGRPADRAQAGKFLTAYPRDDDHLRTLAGLLDEVTAALPGPAILSDRPVRAGSLVHYRYGAFAGVPVLTNDASLEVRLEAPDGRLVEDARLPWFSPPPWAELPWPGSPGRSTAVPAKPKPVLLGGRFRVERAIRHSARGGVYRAVDLETGDRVVVKQARAHGAGFSHSGTLGDGLRYESEMLAELGELAPRVVRLFAQDDHLFLALEELTGRTLGAWAHRWWHDLAAPADGPPMAEALAMAERLAGVVDAVHARGLVFRDLAPSNVMVCDDGGVRLVDAELTARPGQWVASAYTPGFAAPELETIAPVAPAPGPPADHFALGALLCHLTTGVVPVPAGVDDRVGLVLDYAVPGNPAARRLATAVRGLTAADPGRRWDTARFRTELSTPDDDDDAGERRELEPDRRDRMLDDGIATLAQAMATGAGERLVPTGEAGARSDPGNAQHGAAGVLAVLVRASELTGGEPVREAVARTARWIDRRRLAVPTRLPGLYFGRSGTAWALYDAAWHLDDPALAERALDLATALPVRWPNPDVTHGTAGLGLASLHLWYETKQPVFLERAEAAADHVLEQARRTGDGRRYWQVAPDFDSLLAGATHYGFAHGVAGIGAFLLAAGQATGRADCLDMAREAGDTLTVAAIRAGGAAYWPNELSGPSDADMRYHWCSGASGVGTFLVRLWRATGEPGYRELAHEAAVTVRRGRWISGISACHGVAGNGEFLLDLAAAAGGPYRSWAGELAACLYARHTVRDGRVVVVDEPGGRPWNLDFQTGLAGVVGFLLRLRHGGPRWWMVDRA